MSTNFPTTYDVIVNPGAGDSLNTTTVVHHSEHSTANDAISAIEQKIGVDGATATGTLDYLLKNSGSFNPGHSHGMSRISAATASFTATALYQYYRVAGSLTASLPPSTGNTQIYWFKNTGSGTITISASGSNTIDGAATAIMNMQYQTIALVDASAGRWDVI